MDFHPIHRIAPDGTVSAVITDLESPNGLAFSPDETILYADNTRRGDECAAEKERGEVCPHQYIRAYDVAPDGSVSNSRMFATMHSAEDGVPDGMKVDNDGRVYFTARSSVYRMRMKTAGINPWQGG